MVRHRIFLFIAVAMFVLTAFTYRSHAGETAMPDDVLKTVEKLEKDFGLKPDEYAIVVDPELQELYLIKNGEVAKTYPVATSRFGIGTLVNSHKTPWGAHRIKEKIGDGMPIGTVFKGRVKQPKLATISTKPRVRVYGAITTRIMWLDGQEPRVNKGGNVDSHARYIYIHGTASEGLIGAPASVGCIEMKNLDVIELFNLVPVGTLVEVLKKEYKKPIPKITNASAKKPAAKKSTAKKPAAKKPPVKKSTKKKSGR